MARPGVGTGDRRTGAHPGKAIRRRDEFLDDDLAVGAITRTPVPSPAAPGSDGGDLFGADPDERRGAGGRLALDDDGRLPWLEPPDDDSGDDDAVQGGRIVGFVLLTLAVLALIAGAAWYAGRHASGPGPADGSLVRAEPGPYKVRPESPGGETFAGTGDSSFAVSEGETRVAALAPVADEPGPSAVPSAATSPAPSSTASRSVGVQLGAFMDVKAAEAGWSAIVQRNPMVGGFSHRVVEGQADIGRVFRLQVVAADLAAARALCATLTARGQGCQVKQ